MSAAAGAHAARNARTAQWSAISTDGSAKAVSRPSEAGAMFGVNDSEVLNAPDESLKQSYFRDFRPVLSFGVRRPADKLKDLCSERAIHSHWSQSSGPILEIEL